MSTGTRKDLIYSIYFHAYFLLFCLTTLPLMLLVLRAIAIAGAPGPLHVFSRDLGLVFPLLASMIVYHCIAIRKVYRTGRGAALVIGIILTFVEPLIWLYVFRPVMFLVVHESI